jgi:hypothetical protein
MIAVAAGLVITMLLAANSYGQMMMSAETENLSGLYSELAGKYGYTEIIDLTYDHSLVEFRSNGTIPIAEDTAAEIAAKYDFVMVEFAPAPTLEEDSIIVVQLVRGA